MEIGDTSYCMGHVMYKHVLLTCYVLFTDKSHVTEGPVELSTPDVIPVHVKLRGPGCAVATSVRLRLIPVIKSMG